MSAMRAVLRTIRLLCALLAGVASAANAPQAPKPQDVLLACPTTRDYVGRVVAAASAVVTYMTAQSLDAEHLPQTSADGRRGSPARTHRQAPTAAPRTTSAR